jgi:hypothetical protein
MINASSGWRHQTACRRFLAVSLRFPGGPRAVGEAESSLQGKGGTAAQDEETEMTNRTDAALTRRVTGARLVTALAVLGGTLALAGLGTFGNLSDGPADGGAGNGLVTVELSESVSHR